MADVTTNSHFVRYTNHTKGWTECFQRLEWRRSFTSEMSVAMHVFQVQVSAAPEGTTRRAETVIELSKTLVKGDIFTFAVERQGQAISSFPQQHVVESWNLSSTLRRGAVLTVWTVDLRAKMNFDRKNRAHQGKLHEIARKIVGEYGFTLEAQDCTPVPEFEILRQANLTDYEFLVSHLCPRGRSGTSGGYELMDLGGQTLRFSTSTYKLGLYETKPEEVIQVDEGDHSFRVARLGGCKLVVTGFDHYGKQPITVTVGEAVSPSFGEFGPSQLGERHDYVPFQTEAGVRSWALSRQQTFRYQAFRFTATLRGTPDILQEPAVLSLLNTKYRESDSAQGYVVAVDHSIKHGVYRMGVICDRDKIDP